MGCIPQQASKPAIHPPPLSRPSARRAQLANYAPLPPSPLTTLRPVRDVAREHEIRNALFSSWSRMPAAAMEHRRTRWAESSRRALEFTAGMMRCSDFAHDDHRRDVHGKHTPSDRPCLGSSAAGPSRRSRDSRYWRAADTFSLMRHPVEDKERQMPRRLVPR